MLFLLLSVLFTAPRCVWDRLKKYRLLTVEDLSGPCRGKTCCVFTSKTSRRFGTKNDGVRWVTLRTVAIVANCCQTTTRCLSCSVSRIYVRYKNIELKSFLSTTKTEERDQLYNNRRYLLIEEVYCTDCHSTYIGCRLFNVEQWHWVFKQWWQLERREIMTFLTLIYVSFYYDKLQS